MFVRVIAPVLLSAALSACATQPQAAAQPALPQAAAQAPAALQGGRWYLKTLDGQPVEAKRRPYLELQDGKVHGFGGCNSFGGSYQLDGSRIVFGPGFSTKMACMDGMQLEHKFMQTLPLARAWQWQGGDLALSDEQGKILAVFMPTL